VSAPPGFSTRPLYPFAASRTQSTPVAQLEAARRAEAGAPHGGQFILRIEDTDQTRSTRESEEAIFAPALARASTWDEGPDIGGPSAPYRQSERSAIYAEHAEMLLDNGTPTAASHRGRARRDAGDQRASRSWRRAMTGATATWPPTRSRRRLGEGRPSSCG
jgi:glutamyl-tRNA synthetase